MREGYRVPKNHYPEFMRILDTIVKQLRRMGTDISYQTEGYVTEGEEENVIVVVDFSEQRGGRFYRYVRNWFSRKHFHHVLGRYDLDVSRR